MYFCVECQEIVNNYSTNNFSYYDAFNTCHNVCDKCFNSINNRLKIYKDPIDHSKLILLKKKISNKTIRMSITT